jgi:hypothetical protein
MQQTRAWLIAFKRAFQVSYDIHPPPRDEDMLDLLRAADERLGDDDDDPQLRPPQKASHH